MEEWLTFIIYDDVEEIKMIDNEFVQKAEDELEYINADEEERMRAKFREKAEWKYNADMKSMYSHGVEQGRTEGRAEGRAEGRTEGRTEGIKEQNIKIAKKMLAKKEKIEYIMEITGLTEEEIKELE